MMILHFKNKRRLLTFTKEQQQYFDIVTEEFEKDKKGKYRAKDCPHFYTNKYLCYQYASFNCNEKGVELPLWAGGWRRKEQKIRRRI